MRRFNLLVLFLLNILFSEYCLSVIPFDFNPDNKFSLNHQDNSDKQVLFNGVVWRNLYPHIRGNQFLFTNDFVKGSVTIEGRRFPDLRLKYDIYNDQILTINERNIIIQVNKEMVDSFSLDYNNRTYRFGKVDIDSIDNPRGYINVLCDGPLTLVVRYRKEILLHAVENIYDIFSQNQKVYLKKDGLFHPVALRRDLFKSFGELKPEVKNYLRSNRIRISIKDPDTLVPAVKYYNSLISSKL